MKDREYGKDIKPESLPWNNRSVSFIIPVCGKTFSAVFRPKQAPRFNLTFFGIFFARRANF